MVFSYLFSNMENTLFKLTIPEYSYFIGFIQADGHLHSQSRNRGKLSIEISNRDIDILEKFQKIIPVNSTIYTRIRNTNYSKNYTGVCLNIFNKNFRDTINYYGVPYGKKSNIIKPPLVDYLEHDYWRGIIDADGSLGITGKGFPYISLVTASEELYQAYSKYLKKYFNIEININRNKRDNIYNITNSREKAQEIIKVMYYNDCLCLNRKYESSKKALEWIRPNSSKSRPKTPNWSIDELKILDLNSIIDSIILLPDRTEEAIKVRKYKLNKVQQKM